MLKTPVSCSKHNIVKKYNSQGTQICKLCVKESAKANFERKIANGIKPKKCKKCDSERHWNTFGQAICGKCRRSYEKGWVSENREHVDSYNEQYRSSNKEKISLQTKSYREKNSSKLRKSRLAYTSSFDREYWVWKAMNARCYNPNSRQYKDWGGRGISVHSTWRRDAALSMKENYPKYLAYKKYIDDVLGPRPSDSHSVDRINNNGNYEPGNLRWATKEEQANNKRTSIKVKSSIPEDSPIYYPYDNLITIKSFSEMVRLPLIVVKYRYAQNWDPQWILYSEYDNRYYEYQGHRYNMSELSLISGILHSTLHSRLTVRRWSVEKAMETPIFYRGQKHSRGA